MFERFTVRARRVMGLSRQEAQRLGSEFIGTEHILLGILQEGDSLAARVLRSFQVDYKSVRLQIEKIVTPSEPPKFTLGQIPFSPHSKRAIELAAEAAVELRHDVIGAEHLLIGLVEETEGIAAKALANLGLRLDDVRGKVLEALQLPDPGAAVFQEASWSVRTRLVVQEAAGEVRMMRSPTVEPEHLLLAILAEKGPAAGLLTRSGITVEAIRGIIPRP
jgi:ATP-dependent Clp protease ATP-binding subunit ClpA